MEYRGPGLRMPAFSETSVKVPSPLLWIEEVRVAGQAARAAHDGNALPLASVRVACGRRLRGIELDVVADEEIEVAVAVVVEKRAAGAPANAFLVQTGFAW